MKRRTMMGLAAAAAGTATLPHSGAEARDATVFEVRTAVDLAGAAGPATLWLPLLENAAGGSQVVRSTS